jgi:hypothetical protein
VTKEAGAIDLPRAGDKLFTDNGQVGTLVPGAADYPARRNGRDATEAADGVILFLGDSRAWYVYSNDEMEPHPDRDGWRWKS